jgi:Flp pilus assembly protein TadD
VVVIVIVLIFASAETVTTRLHITHWRDTVSLYKHMLALTPDAAPLHNNLGIALQSQGRLDEAISHYRRALQINPNFASARNNLGLALEWQDKQVKEE